LVEWPSPKWETEYLSGREFFVDALLKNNLILFEHSPPKALIYVNKSAAPSPVLLFNGNRTAPIFLSDSSVGEDYVSFPHE
jgi:hypothetical protein